MLGESASPDEIAKLRTTLGLDKPLVTQYRAYLAGVARGNLGTSFRFGTPVTEEIRKRLADTAILAVSAMAVAIVFAIPLGIVAAVFRGRLPDHAAMTLALAGISMPSFWLGPLLAILFAVRLGWLPVSGSGTPRTWCCPR
jgi:ABC-type dipeptide/oligopeptide/nickel transport system permease component